MALCLTIESQTSSEGGRAVKSLAKSFSLVITLKESGHRLCKPFMALTHHSFVTLSILPSRYVIIRRDTVLLYDYTVHRYYADLFKPKVAFSTMNGAR